MAETDCSKGEEARPVGSPLLRGAVDFLVNGPSIRPLRRCGLRRPRRRIEGRSSSDLVILSRTTLRVRKQFEGECGIQVQQLLLFY